MTKIFGHGQMLLGVLMLVTTDIRAQYSLVAGMIDGVNLDSLTNTIRVLSGEMGSKNEGMTDTVFSRMFRTSTHDLAIEYLKSTLEGYGLPVQLQSFEKDSLGGRGTNVIAVQRGTGIPGKKYILCGHFDSISELVSIAPGADDNASGCAAVLETARLLSRYKTTYTIVYAFWDQEEIGLRGSHTYADSAAARGDTILGVLNADMLGWDGDNDGNIEVHASGIARSWELAFLVSTVSKNHWLGLAPQLYLEGSSGSDHASFWEAGYPAIFLIEGFEGGDFNPYRHSHSDRLESLNLPYFRQFAKLVAGSTAYCAGIQEPLAVAEGEPVAGSFRLEQNYPNPFNPATTIKYTVGGNGPWGAGDGDRAEAGGAGTRSQGPGAGEAGTRGGKDGTRDWGLGTRKTRLVVYDLLGRQVTTLVDEVKAPGSYEVRFDGSGLASGVYVYRLTAGSSVLCRTMTLLK